MARSWFIWSFFILLSGCASVHTRSGPMASRAYQARPEAPTAPVLSDQTALSKQDIETLLGSKLTLPKKARIGVVAFHGNGSGYSLSQRSMKLDEGLKTGFFQKLTQSPRIADVQVIPHFLLSDSPSVSSLRAVGARMQSDLILLVQWSDQDFREIKFIFGKDRAKNIATVEAMLLDVRTGVIPFSSAVTEEYALEEAKEDLSIQETESRARQAAFNKAMAGLGDGLASFLRGVP